MSKIIALEVENFKRLKAVRITPNGNLVVISGENEQGKTSVLDAIMAAIRGKRYTTSEPIRRGQEHGVIKLDTGDLQIIRTFTKTKDGEITNDLKVYSKENGRVKSPQDVLNILLPAIGYDPISFVDLKPREQYDILKKFVSAVDIEDIDRQRQELYEERTNVNRKANDAKTRAIGIVVPEVKNSTRVDVDGLTRQLAEASRTNAEIVALQNERGNKEASAAQQREVAHHHRQMVEQCKQRIATIQAEMKDYAARAEKSDVAAAQLEVELENAAPLPALVNGDDLKAKIDAGNQQNRIIDTAARAMEERTKLFAEAESLEAESERLTKRRDGLQAEKEAAVAAATMPVPSLGFGDGEILMDGLPFSDASGAVKLRTSIAIAAALNPHLNISIVRDGDKLDSKSMQILEEFCQETGHQCWIERVADAGEGVGFVMVNGEVANG